MGSRSRRRERVEEAAAPAKRKPAKAHGTKAAAPAPKPAPSPAPDPVRRGYARGRERDQAAREALDPLEPGERPTAVTVGAIVAALLAVANIVAYLAGARVQGQENSIAGILLFAGLMLAAAGGMWRAKYWAVLGFEALLGITVVISSLALTVASNWQAAVLCTVVIGSAGTLFFKLIRAMARMQMPERPAR
jgi:hypothetical protein